MLTTLVGVAAALALILPGFVIADLAQSRRASTTSDSEWRLVLRALSYALVLHLVFGLWTRWLLVRIATDQTWAAHVGAITIYAVTVLVVTPVVAGLLLNKLLLGAEQRGDLKPWHYALGGRDARFAWDFIFQRLPEGSWISVTVKGDETNGPKAIGARFGKASWASQSPLREHDLYLQEIWTLDDKGVPKAAVDPPQGVWLSASQIESISYFEPPEFPVRRQSWRKRLVTSKKAVIDRSETRRADRQPQTEAQRTR